MIRRSISGAAGLALLLTAGLTVAARPSPELVVHAPPELEPVAREVRAVGSGDFTAVLTITGQIGFTAPIRVVLAPENSPTARRTPRWIAGFADGAARTVVLFPARVSRYPDDSLVHLLHHEVAHVLVAEAAAGRPVPRWFNEGVATVAAREWGIEDRARYAAAVMFKGPKSGADLDRGFAAGGRQARRSYALSSAFVRWLQREYGAGVTATILSSLARDTGFREAFVRATGTTLERAEHRFFVREAVWHTWVPFLTSSGVLWAAITALALIAIQRRRARSATMRRKWDDEDGAIHELEPTSPPLRRFGAGRRRNLDDADDDLVN